MILYAGADGIMTGGIVGDNLRIQDNASFDLSGGRVGRGVVPTASNDFTIQGDDFRLNGLVVGPDTVAINSGDILTGTLADGTTFIFSDNVGDTLRSVNLVDVGLAAPNTTPVTIPNASTPVPKGVRRGETLLLFGGATVPDNYAVTQGTMTLASGGSAGNRLEAYGANIQVLGGSIGLEFAAHDSTTVRIQGNVGNDFQAFAGSVVNLEAGYVGTNFQAHGEVNISGGTIDESFIAQDGSVITQNAGLVSSGFVAKSGSEYYLNGGQLADGATFEAGSLLQITGYGFRIDGALQNLEVNTPFEVLSRNVEITGFFDNGQAFSFLLNPSIGIGGSSSSFTASSNSTMSIFDPNATILLNATQAIPEPTTAFMILASGTLLMIGRGRKHGSLKRTA